MVNQEQSIANVGDFSRIAAVMRKAAAGGHIVLGAIGGSITQGCGTSNEQEKPYINLVAHWWREKFPHADVALVNAGIGATDSQYGVHRVQQHLLCYDPDFVIVEFSVNDSVRAPLQETYEGLLRRILSHPTCPGVMMMNTFCYDSGDNAQEMHNVVGRHYQLPIVSVRDAVYPLVKSGALDAKTIAPDLLHPNDDGQRLQADLLIHLLEKIYAVYDKQPQPVLELPAPYTTDRYEDAVLLDNTEIQPDYLGGWQEDTTPKEDIRDIFKCGWEAKETGAPLRFTVRAGYLSIQYRKTIDGKSGVAKVVVDGDHARAVRLDGDFTGGWGDYLDIADLLHDHEARTHTVELTMDDIPENKGKRFYVAALLAANRE